MKSAPALITKCAPTVGLGVVLAAMLQVTALGQAGAAVEIPEPLPGQLSSKFRIDSRNPEGSVPSTKERDANPLEYGYLLQDLLTRAEQARQQHDYKAVVQYYRAVAKAVPENAKGWSKLCEAYEAADDPDRAIRACRYALERPGVELQDYLRTVRLMLSKGPSASPEERLAAREVLKHLDQQPGLELVAAQLKCEVGVKQQDVALLEACTQVLASRAPDDAKTIVFQWNLAVQKGQQADARRLLERAKKAGVVMANVERMQTVTESSARPWRNIMGIAVTALFAVATLVYLLRRKRLMPHTAA